jgi:hypothetical protein
MTGCGARRGEIVENRMRTARTASIFIAAACAALMFCSAPARAEVQKFLNPCGQQLCASYQLVLTPPDGWAINKQASRQNKIQVMVPNGMSFATAEPLIYVEVFYHRDEQQTLAEFARVSNARWVAANTKAKISELPSNAATASRRSFASPSIIRTRRSRPMRSARSASIPTKTVTSSFSTW